MEEPRTPGREVGGSTFFLRRVVSLSKDTFTGSAQKAVAPSPHD